MSWEEIRKAGLLPHFPTIAVAHLLISVDELCLEGDRLRPLQPNRTVCVQWDAQMQYCLQEETVRISTPRHYTQIHCLQWKNQSQETRCIRDEIKPAIHAMQYQVPVFKVSPRDQRTEVFKKSFIIPICEP